MAKIGCLKPFRGAYNNIKNIILEDGEIAFTTDNKRIYMGNGVDPVIGLTPFIDNNTIEIPFNYSLLPHYSSGVVKVFKNGNFVTITTTELFFDDQQAQTIVKHINSLSSLGLPLMKNGSSTFQGNCINETIVNGEIAVFSNNLYLKTSDTTSLWSTLIYLTD